MGKRKKAVSTTANLPKEQGKDNDTQRITQHVKRLFLAGKKYTACGINEVVGFNDARKVISSLRASGWDIRDYTMEDRRKVYWLEEDERQLKINFEKEVTNE